MNENKTKPPLNEALRLLRVFSDNKSKEMACFLGISPSYLSEIESGKKEPSLSLIDKYAKFFKTSPSTILFFSESLGLKRQPPRLKNFLVKNILSFLQNIEKANSFELPISE